MTEAERIEDKLLQTTSKAGLVNLCKSYKSQLKSAQELNRELVGYVDNLVNWSPFQDFFPDEARKLEALLNKAK